ncbi:FAD-binding protein [Streptomyces sp. NPDC048106]|uniref:FAD-binding protein n=1 Tax=Streptomyces sp. NPDC048106 TaxID=3155750 RepID=UPI003453BA98
MSAVEQFDVVVVGAGIAGTCAAIEAADHGAKVLLLDLGWGGGASSLSGGVVYGGGGTAQQREAGVEDSPEEMYKYIRQEVDGLVSDDTVRRFAEQSAGNIRWLESNGARFRGTLCTYKTSYPTDAHYLYYSGNEKAWPYNQHAKPAPRGHRVVATALSSGKVLMDTLLKSAASKHVDFRPQSKVDDLIITNGAVTGLRYRTATRGALSRKLTVSLWRLGGKLGNWAPAIGKRLNAYLTGRWERKARPAEVHAGSVILAAGGFVYNKEMKDRYAVGAYADTTPLGTIGDDGTGIRLGVDAGGTTAHMEKMSAWRFISPPSGFIEGIVVGPRGTRVANEDLYGATLAHHMITDHEGKGFLILDSRQFEKAKSQVSTQTQLFQRGQMTYFFHKGAKKASSVRDLAKMFGLPESAVAETVEAYNKGLAGDGDPAHKMPDVSSPIEKGPFYGIDVSVQATNPLYSTPCLTLGGLRVDERTGQVLTETDSGVPGLYAAGRTAVGICTNNYVSGLSLADGVFSGRRAGAACVGRDVRA